MYTWGMNYIKPILVILTDEENYVKKFEISLIRYDQDRFNVITDLI